LQGRLVASLSHLGAPPPQEQRGLLLYYQANAVYGSDAAAWEAHKPFRLHIVSYQKQKKGNSEGAAEQDGSQFYLSIEGKTLRKIPEKSALAKRYEHVKNCRFTNPWGRPKRLAACPDQ